MQGHCSMRWIFIVDDQPSRGASLCMNIYCVYIVSCNCFQTFELFLFLTVEFMYMFNYATSEYGTESE
ncbi:unnamed protein product [Camellia sinensis]